MDIDLEAHAPEEIQVDQETLPDAGISIVGAVQRRGRGFNSQRTAPRDGLRGNDRFDRHVGDDTSNGSIHAQKSIEGWIIIITNIHEEASDEDLYELLADYGPVRNRHLNLDRRTGYVKGYALAEYDTFDEAKAAIDGLDGTQFLDQRLSADFAFTPPPLRSSIRARKDRPEGRGRELGASLRSRLGPQKNEEKSRTDRSLSPPRRR